MPLGLTVSLIVLGVIVVAGVAGYCIDKSTERWERDDQ